MIPVPEGEFATAVAIFDQAMSRVVGDPAVWVEEAAPDRVLQGLREPLPWPLRATGEGWPQFLLWRAEIWVERLLQALAQAFGPQWVPEPLDALNVDFALILRVVKRGADQAEKATQAEFVGKRGGGHQLGDKQEFKDYLREVFVDEADRGGRVERDPAAVWRDLGVSRAQFYRILERVRRRR